MRNRFKWIATVLVALLLLQSVSFPSMTESLFLRTQKAYAEEATSDTEVPSIPSNLNCSSKTNSSITLTWTSSTDNVGVAGYEIYRGDTKIGTSNAISYSDEGLSPNTTYIYTVKAYDAAGNTSADCSPLEVTTDAAGTTPDPTVTVIVSEEPGVTPGGETIETLIPTPTPTMTSTPTLTATQTFTTTPMLTATPIDTQAPSIPVNPVVVLKTLNSIKLSWTASQDDIAVNGYRIYRDDKEIADTKDTFFYDKGLTPGTSYNYYIKAYDEAGNTSGNSNIITTNTQTDFYSGLVGYWRLNEGQGNTALDSSGYGNNGTLSAAGTWIDGVRGKALSFNGSTDNVAVSRSISDDFTIGFWVNTTQTAGETQWYSGSGLVDAYVAGMTNDFGTALIGNKFGFGIGNPDKTIVSNTPINDGVWHYCVATREKSSGTIKVFVDGKKEASDVAGTQSLTVASYIKFGSIQTNCGYFNGGLDEIRIYNRALNDAEVTDLYSSETANKNIDQEPPSTPQNVISSSSTETSVELSWDESSDNTAVIGYHIFRNGTRVGTTFTTQYTDRNLNLNTAYNYTIIAFDAENNFSSASSAMSVTTLQDTVPPSIPENIKVTSNTNTSITLAWNPSSDNVGVSGYKVYRNGTCIGNAAGTSYTDTGLSQNTTYSYTVKAYDISGNISNESSPVNGTTAISINYNMTLSEDKTYNGVYLSGGTLNLNGHKLTINGGLTQVGGTLYVNGGQLEVTGDYKIDNNGNGVWAYLNMTNASDYVRVGGNFLMNSSYNHEGCLTEGNLEIKGNFTEYYPYYAGNFKATGSHKVILSGEGLQTVYFSDTSNSRFNTLELKNNSTQGVKFNSVLLANSFITNGCTVSVTTISPAAWKLNEDVVLNNNLYLAGSSLDLNGHKLKINGSLIHTGGTLYVNGGQLEVTGDYKIDNNGNYVWAYLNMTNALDYVRVGGNFLMNSSYNHEGCLAAGTLEVKGNFTEYYSYYAGNFKATGSHKVILSGGGLQTVYFSDTSSSRFNILELKNYSAEGIKFNSILNVGNFITNGCNISVVTISSMSWKLNEDITLNNSLNLAGSSIDLNGYKLTINGNVTQTGGTMYINGGQLVVTGDYKIDNNGNYVWAYLNMTNALDYVRVGGNFLMNSSYNHEGCLTAGTLEVKGNFTEYYSYYAGNFKATGSHKVILSGGGLQTVYFSDTSSSRFNILELKNYSAEGIKFNSILNVGNFITNGCNISVVTISSMSWKLNEDITLNNSLNLAGSSIDLNGHKLTINGNVTQTGGTMYINGGQLVVTEDYKIDNSGNGVWAYLNMTNASDYVCVGGNFLMNSEYSHEGHLTAGTLEIKGNFTEWYPYNSGNFKATGSHKVILSGGGLQTVYFSDTSYSRFNTLELKNYSTEGVKFNSVFNAVNLVTNQCDINIATISPMGWKLSEDITLNNNLNLAGSSLDLNGHKLTINGSLIQTGGTLYVNGGQLEVTGDYKIDNNGNGVWAYLNMTNVSDYVRVGGNFLMNSEYSHEGHLTAGTLEIKGNFTEWYPYYSGNFKTTGSHKVILSGGGLQTVYFSDTSYSRFNILGITKPIDTGYAFNVKPIWNTLITIDNDTQLPSVPLGLTVSSKTYSTVSLAWNASTDNVRVSGYEIHRDGVKINTTSSTSYKDTGLLPESTHTYTIKAVDISGNVSDLSEALEVTTEFDSELPTAPDGISVTSKVDTSITISWKSSTDNVGVAGYEVYRNGQKIGDTTELSYTDTGLMPSTNYSYSVKAYDAAGNISNSCSTINVTTAEDIIPPSIPADLKLSSKTVTTVTLAWTASTDNIGVLGYEVYRDSVKIGTTSVTSFTDQGLKPDTTYSYTVKAYDAAKNSSTASTLLTVTTDKDILPPSVPGSLSITSKTANSVTITWTVSSDNVGVTGYDIYRDGNKISTVVGTTYTDSNLLPGAYRYSVKALDASANVSGASNTVIFDNEVPAKPEGLKEENKTASTVTFSWTASTDNIGVAGYEVYRDGNRIKTVTDTKYTDGGLLPVKTYSYAVKALDGAGNASNLSDSIEITTLTDTTAPSNPANLAVYSKTGSTVTLKWSPSTDDIGVTGYEVYRDSVKIGTSDNVSYTYTGLTANTVYVYTIKAYDEAGNISAESNSISAIPMIPRITSIYPVNGATIGGAGKKTLYVYYANSGNMIGSRAVFEYSQDGTNWALMNDMVSGPGVQDSNTLYLACNWDLNNISSGDYQVRYTVYDAADHSDTRTVSYQVDRTPPAALQNLTSTAGAGFNVLTWSPGTEADLSGYRVYRTDQSDGELTLLSTINGRDNTTYKDLNIQAGTTYYYQITAVDKFDQEGAYSSTANSTALPDDVPPVILGIEPLEGSILAPDATIIVRAEDNLLLSSIKLQYSADGGNTWTDIQSINTRDNASFQWNTAGMDGQVEVRAIAYDASGNASDGNAIRTYTIDSKGPSKVTGLSATAYITNIVLHWADVPDQDFSYFKVERKDSQEGSFADIGNVYDKLGMNVSGLTPDKTYWFRVTAYDINGNKGTVSDEIQVGTLKDTVAPAIIGLGPVPGYFAAAIPLYANASDNFKVTSLVFQISQDKVGWSNIANIDVSSSSQTAYASYTLDVSKYSDGSYFFRAIAYDGEGNHSSDSSTASYIEYKVDHTPPSKPSGFTVMQSTGDITLNWQKGPETDLKSYKLYKAEGETGTYTVIANSISSLSYTDYSAEPGKTYYYKVSAVDAAGNESEFAGPVSGKLEPDIEAPRIISIYPDNGETLPANPTIRVLAADNYKLSRVTAEYRLSSSEENSWIAIGSKDLSVYSDVAMFSWNTNGLSEGDYVFRTKAVDKAGNESPYTVKSIHLNLIAPSKPVLKAVPGGWKVDLSWTSNTEPDFAGYRIYRGDVSGGKMSYIGETTGTAYTDRNVKPGISYFYEVQALDIYNNSSYSEEVAAFATDEDTIPPKAEAGDSRNAILGIEVQFDGTQSTDNDRISSYLWDFGDGQTSTVAQPIHTYVKEGTYTVGLTVTDFAGNSSSDTLSIRMYSPQQAGTLELKVLDEGTGLPVPGATVYVDFPDSTPKSYTTNGLGIATIVATPGNYNVSAYKTDYLPREINTSIVQYQKTQDTISLKKGQLVVGDLNVRRLSLQEITDAGIDINAEENQFVYKFEVHLEFEQTPLPVQYMYVNGQGQILGGFVPITIGGGTASEGTGSSGGTAPYGNYNGTVTPQAISDPGHPEIPPTIAYLVIPKQVTWLKEFFEVSLVLQNMADPQFVIENSRALLKLPDGISLAPTKDPQSLDINIGDIAGGETKQVKWIIRGDQKGLYDLEASFNGTLMPFKAPVTTTFKTKEAFRVWGGDALHIYVMAEDSAYIGEDYYVQFALVNESDMPVYNVKTNFGTYIEPTPKQEVVVIQPDGTKEVIHSDGSEDITYSDKKKERINTDGTKNITYLDGTIEAVRIDGVKDVTYPDGRTDIVCPEKTVVKPDGSREVTYSDGSQQCLQQRSSEKSFAVSEVNIQPGANEEEQGMPAMRSGDSLNIDYMMPGEVKLGTFVTQFNESGDPDEVYYELTKAFSQTSGDSNTEIPVTISTIPSHMNKYKVVLVQQDSFWGDPVDTNTGAQVIEHSALSVTGATALSFDISYSSRQKVETDKVKKTIRDSKMNYLKFLGESTMGAGWSHNYETRLEKNPDGNMIVYWSPYSYTIFYNKNASNRQVYGTVDPSGKIIVSKVMPEGEQEYYAKQQGMENYILKRKADGTYQLSCGGMDAYSFDDDGKLISFRNKNGLSIELTYEGNQLVTITEPISGQSLRICYNEKGYVEKVVDKTGRFATFDYDENAFLTAYTDVNGHKTTYTYDAEGKVLTGTNAEGITYFVNTYDPQGRIATQDDARNDNQLTRFSYDDKSEYWHTITTITERNGTTRKVVHNRLGQLIRIEDELGNKITYTYDANGNNTSETAPNGYTVISTYDGRGNKLTESNNIGVKCIKVYDNQDNVLTEEDALGNKTTYTYDTNNNIQTITDEVGNVVSYTYDEYNRILTRSETGYGTTSYAYDEMGRLKTSTDSKGHLTTYTYDQLGRVQDVTDAKNNITHYEYDNMGNVLSITKPSGNKVSFTYDSEGNKLTETDEKGNVTRYYYNGNGQLERAVDAQQNTTTYVYDEEDRLTKVIRPDECCSVTSYYDNGQVKETTDFAGKTTAYTYDQNGNILSQKSPKGGITAFEYYADGKVHTVKDALGNTTTNIYDTAGRKTGEINALGKETKFEYYPNGNLKKTIDPLAHETSFTYDSQGKMLTKTDAKGNTTYYEYDLNGNIIKITDALGHTTSYEYNEIDELVKVTDARGNSTTMSYDKDGNLTGVTDASGNTVTTVYDANGNVVQVKDALGRVILENEYDELNQVKKTKNALGKVTEYQYDKLGRLIEVINELSQKAIYNYDNNNRLISVVDSMNGNSKQSYDDEGNLISITDANNNETQYDFDLSGRLIEETTAFGGTKSYSYNALNLLDSTKNGRGQETKYTYDDAGRLTGIADETGTVSYTYDENDNVLTVSDSKGTISREYDALDRVTKYTDARGNTLQYEFDEVGNLVKLVYPGNKTVQYSYDVLNRLETVKDWAGRITRYEYNAVGNLIKTTRPNGTVLTMDYDAAGQMIHQKDVDKNGNIIDQYDYEYDDSGNLISEISPRAPPAFNIPNIAMTCSEGNRLATYNGQQVAYDQDGNMVNGPLKGSMQDFIYDARNRLISAGSTTYSYDAENTRISVTDAAGETNFVVNSEAYLSQVLIRTDAHGKQTFYIYGIGLIGEEDSTGAYRTYHYDSRGSTVAITDINGAVTDTIDYAPYGEIVQRTGTTNTPFLFNGQFGVMTDDNGLYYMRSRYYNPEIKRFINMDVVVGNIGESQSLNRFAYANGNPVSFTDPFGTSRMDPAMLAAHGMSLLLDFIPLVGTAKGIIEAVTGEDMITGTKLAGWERGLAAIAAIPFLGGLARGAVRGTIKGFTAAAEFIRATKAFSRISSFASAASREIRAVANISRRIGKAALLGPLGATIGDDARRITRIADEAAGEVRKVAKEAEAGEVNFMDASDQFFKNVSNRADVDPNGFFDIIAHGNSKKIRIETPNGPVVVDHRTAARLIKQLPGYNGQNIRLLSCSTGKIDRGFAQGLSTRLNVDVLAPTDILWAYPNGKMIVAPRSIVNSKVPDLSKLGSFKLFKPGNY